MNDREFQTKLRLLIEEYYGKQMFIGEEIQMWRDRFLKIHDKINPTHALAFRYTPSEEFHLYSPEEILLHMREYDGYK